MGAYRWAPCGGCAFGPERHSSAAGAAPDDVVASRVPARQLTKMAEANFAVRFDMLNSGDNTRPLNAPNLGDKLGRNTPQSRAASPLIRPPPSPRAPRSP